MGARAWVVGFVLVGCWSAATADDRLRVGVWNIERLSATASRGFPELMGDEALPPRTDADLQRMATYIRDELDVDALMISEVEADSPDSTETRPQSQQLNRLVQKLGSNWRYFLGRTGGEMRLGLLFNTDRVRLKKLVNLHAPEFPVSGKDVLDRDPFIVWIAARDGQQTQNDVLLICVHLKSQQQPYKDNRMAAIAKLVGDYRNAEMRDALTLPAPAEEPDVVILGDCNDASFRSNGFRFLFDYLQGVGFQHLRPSTGPYPHTRINGSQIDHLFASTALVRDGLVPDSFQVHTVAGGSGDAARMDYRRSFSDHFPVTVDIRISEDRDFTVREALATEDPARRQDRMAALQDVAFTRAARSASAGEAPDDEDDGPLKGDFEVRDDNFEAILAPAAFTDPQQARRPQRPAATRDEHEVAIRPQPSLFGPPPTADASVPADRYAKSTLPVVFLEQNWTPAESLEFYSLRQGSPLMRRVFFDALEQPDGPGLFRDSDYLAGFGFLPRRPHPGNSQGYPVGFTGTDAVELTCAACHTSKLTYEGKEYWIDGSQAMTDVQGWLHELVRAIELTLADAPDLSQLTFNRRLSVDLETKFGRFVQRLTETDTPTAAQVQVITHLLRQELDRRRRYNDYNDFGRTFADESERQAAPASIQYGFGRLDALGAILNQACAEHLDAPENARSADAPVNYPAIWDAPQHEHVQWNGAVDNTARFGPLGRNAGQVIGVFGLVDTEDTLVGYDSSVRFDAIERAEQLVTKLWSPEWPEAFGLDHNLVAAGETIYRSQCIQCHALIDRDDPQRRANDVLVPIDEVYGAGGKLGTDALAASNWKDRTAMVGRLKGRNVTLPFRGRFPRSAQARVPARQILSHMVFNTIARTYVPWREELTIEDAHAQRAMTYSAPSVEENLMRYKARPLNGIWSTAPYLHNGSVLNLRELLQPPSQRLQTFRVGSVEFDPENVGFVNDGPFQVNTNLPGNSNRGHAYGTELSDQQKHELLEYLKSL